MLRYIKKALKDKFLIGILLIVIAASFFRFWNYFNRWGLAYDQGQFAVVARYALENMQLPFLGPFSSGGPFQTGGQWYWIVMLGTSIYPKSIITPWIFVTILTIFAVIVMVMVGKIYVNKTFGLILGILLAVSPAQIYQSTNLTNQTPIILISALSLLFSGFYIKRRELKYIFLLAITIGFGTTIHIQSVALIPFLGLLIIFYGKEYLKKIILVSMGLFIPWIPVLLADYQNNFYNTQQILNYYSNQQASTSYDVLGRRWLTFITVFIPTSWGQIIGGSLISGYIQIIFISVFFVYSFLKKKIEKEGIFVAFSLGIMFIILRYLRTPLFESFFVFIHPFIIFLTGWLIYKVYKISKKAGILIAIIICVSSVYSFWRPINESTNNTFDKVEKLKYILYEKYPNVKFSIFDYDANNSSTSMPLVLNLYMDDRLSLEGKKIGLYRFTKDSSTNIQGDLIYDYDKSFQLYDISASESSILEQMGWSNYNPKTVYDETQHWFRKKN